MSVFLNNGKKYLRVSVYNFNKYLDIVSPYRIKNFDNKIFLPCSLKDSKKMWCDTCNSGIGSWTNSCIKTISSINVVKYSEILKKVDDEKDINNYTTVEIDCNDDNQTI